MARATGSAPVRSRGWRTGSPVRPPVRRTTGPEVRIPLDVDTLLAANQAYYDAFEAADLDAMSDVWEHSERVVCTHPGWSTLRGWASVTASWVAIFGASQRLQFILTEPLPEIVGEVGWVSVNENVLGAADGTTIAALNVFVHHDDRWAMVAHHAGQVVGS
ncbi:MAG: nuclear transport factor 2 family protein [Actinomycetota bacterium]|nr:nuclear transport factor 2 family protein [Actinomycetota bacterium]